MILSQRDPISTQVSIFSDNKLYYRGLRDVYKLKFLDSDKLMLANPDIIQKNGAKFIRFSVGRHLLPIAGHVCYVHNQI